MNKTMTLPALLAILLVSSPGTAFAIPSLCNFDDIAIFAFNSVLISKDASVEGDVVANSESPGPVLNDGAEVALDKNCVVNGNVSGQTIDLDKQSTINGNATYVELSNQGTITGTQTIGSPPYTDVPDFQPASPGGNDVFVGAGETVILGDESFCSVSTGTACSVNTDCPLFPGNPDDICELAPVTTYGDILISGGGTVVFAGGRSFDVRSIGPGASGGNCPFPCTAIEFDAPTDLRVEGRVDTVKNSFVGPATGSGIGASDIVIYVGGANGGAGGLLDTPFAVNIGQGEHGQG